MLSRKQRFIRSKCDRCGKATPAKDGEWDLYVLPNKWGEPLADQGCFCNKCCEKFDKENWLEWFKTHRPGYMSSFI